MAQTHEFTVKMSCEGCSGAVNRVLGKFKDNGIENFVINLEAQNVLVTTTMSADEILELIKKTGKQVQFVKTV